MAAFLLECTIHMDTHRDMYMYQKQTLEESFFLKIIILTAIAIIIIIICFNLYSEAVMRDSVDEMEWAGIIVSGRYINNLCFADDIVLIVTSLECLQELMNAIHRISQDPGTQYN